MRSLKLLGVVLVTGLLAGCSIFMGTRNPSGPGPIWVGPHMFEQVKGVRGGPDAFSGALAMEYRSLALEQGDGEKDWPNAYIFAQKGLAASGGQAVLPEDPAAWPTLTPADRAALTDGRGRLAAALDGGARTSNPPMAAHAQGLYECWLEESSEHETQDADACRGAFLAALAALTQRTVVAPAPVTTQDFVVYFAWDRSDLDAAAQRVIDMAAAAARSAGQARINLVGHADLSGSPDYNLRLSLRRADAVRQALVARGITADRTNVTGVGDSEPAVATARGVREPRNRFVSITVR
jgi:OOP family OmpA-OmpF porin